MLKYFIPFVSPLVLLFSFWLFFYNQKGLVWLYGISLLTIIISGRILAKSFWRFRLLWLNLATAYTAQLLFLLLLKSNQFRYVLSFLIAVAWFHVFWMIKNYFDNWQDKRAAEYLVFGKFFYYLSFWFLSTGLYSLIIFLNLSVFYAVGIMILASAFWSWGISFLPASKSFGYLALNVFLLAQVFLCLYLLPVSFYISGTIATLWFFFIIDDSVQKSHNFKLILSLFLASVILVFTSFILR